MNTFVVKIIWGALTLSQMMYGAVLFLLPHEGATAAPLPLWLPAIIASAVSLFLFTTKLSFINLQTLFARNDLKAAAAKVFPLYVICWALNESVAMFGFVNAFIATRQFNDYLPYLAAGVVLNLIMFPKLDAHIREAQTRQAAGQS